MSEHFALEYRDALTDTRNVVAPAWERWLFAPYNFNYHLDHHLYAGVPGANLPELHRRLMGKPASAESAHLTYGYITGVLRECVAA